MSDSAFSATQQQASTLYLPPGPWTTVLDCLCAKFPAISREQWLDRIARGRVLDADGNTIAPDLAYREGLKIHYFREVPNETPIPVVETILYADEHLVVADKPHFLPVTPAGEYVEQTLLRRLIHRLDNPDLVPLHRIDRHTAGLVLFSANRQTRWSFRVCMKAVWSRANRFFACRKGQGPATRRRASRCSSGKSTCGVTDCTR